MKQQLTLFQEQKTENNSKSVVNVASIPQRSPFRYPGGKTWMIPTVREWLGQNKQKPKELIEPFAGGGIVSLTAAFEKLADHVTMVEKDEEVAAVWHIILSERNGWLAEKIFNFKLTHDNIKSELEKPNKELWDMAFTTILKNRVLHGGIIAKGSGLIKNGENGKGIGSRWYPNTLRNRILAINWFKNKISFVEGDAFDIINVNLNNKDAYFFIDPPYTVAGKRLYTYYEINHELLFEKCSQLSGKFMLTYDDTKEIRHYADKFSLKYKTIPMKTTHHLEKNEIIISDNFDWWMS